VFIRDPAPAVYTPLSREPGGVRAPANPVGGGWRHQPGGWPHSSLPPAPSSRSTVQSQVTTTDRGIDRSGWAGDHSGMRRQARRDSARRLL